ncbi:protein PIN-LIKES 1 isoform X2 [Citrus sinensis]|uniref:protein PIN-LIKES 1 isoform X2 n=1 Tax=Citrus sinensis TaxID=2711 RepID=UPI002277CBE0|nr:protein PIN-LIKES 1 isoform X2 [Citrus sinensis]
MKILDLFIAAFIPVLKVLLLTALGLFLALDRIDILGDLARQHLNKVVFFVFNPALVGSSLADHITAEGIGMLMLCCRFFSLSRSPSLYLSQMKIGNLGNMLFIIIPAICKERGSPFGDADACYRQGMVYSALSMAIGAIYMWSYVYNIVRIYSSCTNSEGEKLDNSTENITPMEETTEKLSNSRMRPLLPLNGCSAVKDHLNHFELDCSITARKPQVQLLEKIKQCFQTFATKFNLRKLFAPSTIAAIVGFMVGIIPEFRKLLIGEHAPLRVVEGSASLLGEASIPTVTLIVGANLLRGLKGTRIQLSLIIGVIVIRYIALPLLGVGIVKGAIHFGFVKSDPLYQFVLLLQFALPPAVNIGTMTQLFRAGESEYSVIMLWTYALASFSLTFWTTFFMWLVK